MKNEREFKTELMDLVWQHGAKAFTVINGEFADKLVSLDDRGNLVAVENGAEDERGGFWLSVHIEEEKEVKGILPAEFGRLGEEQDLSECVRYEEIMLIMSGKIMAEACQKLLAWIESGEAWLAYIDYIKTKDEDD